MKLLFICGPFGSGTSAVAGLLHRLGAIGFGPYLKTNDERTPNSYEFLPFRETVLSLVSEEQLSFREGATERATLTLQQFRNRIENQEFGPFDSKRDTIFLKYPPSALLISQVCETFDTRLIYVVRSPEEIERTQQRRGWYEFTGRPAATAIYAHMFKVLVENSYPTMIVRYAEVLTAPKKVARALASFGELMVGSKKLADAVGFIRQPGPESISNVVPLGRARQIGRSEMRNVVS